MDDLLIEHPAEGVMLLRINRPAVRNALSLAVRQRLLDALEQQEANGQTRCIVIAGGEKAFAAGADLGEQEDLGPVGMMLRDTGRIWDAIAMFPKPIISAVRGYALGGGFELALITDIIIAGESAVFALPEVRLGQLPGGGGTQRLVRLVGKHLAMELLLSGRRFSAADAFRMGIVNRVVPDAEAEEVAVRLAAEIAGLPPLAVRQVKEVTLRGAEGPLSLGLLLERRAGQVLYDSEDKKEGLRAFREKRDPRFSGR